MIKIKGKKITNTHVAAILFRALDEAGGVGLPLEAVRYIFYLTIGDGVGFCEMSKILEEAINHGVKCGFFKFYKTVDFYNPECYKLVRSKEPVNRKDDGILIYSPFRDEFEERLKPGTIVEEKEVAE